MVWRLRVASGREAAAHSSSVRTTRLVLRHYQADNQAGSWPDNPGGTLLPAQSG